MKCVSALVLPVWECVHVNNTVAHFDVVRRNVICPEIERAAAAQIKAGMVPMTGEYAVLYAAAVEREAKMGATIVDSRNLAIVCVHGDGAITPAHDDYLLSLQFF
jgi:hypothetical protein